MTKKSSKTGGGKGTNQHGVKGVSKRRDGAGSSKAAARDAAGSTPAETPAELDARVVRVVNRRAEAGEAMLSTAEMAKLMNTSPGRMRSALGRLVKNGSLAEAGETSTGAKTFSPRHTPEERAEMLRNLPWAPEDVTSSIADRVDDALSDSPDGGRALKDRYADEMLGMEHPESFEPSATDNDFRAWALNVDEIADPVSDRPTVAPVMYEGLRPGDRFDYGYGAERTEVEVLEAPSDSDGDSFGRPMRSVWARNTETDEEGTMPFGPGAGPLRLK